MGNENAITTANKTNSQHPECIECVVITYYKMDAQTTELILRASNCSGEFIHMHCPDGHEIRILSMQKGYSSCRRMWKTKCCPNGNDEKKNSDYDRKKQIENACSKRSSCLINVQKYGIISRCDYEIVTWTCLSDVTSLPSTSPFLPPSTSSSLSPTFPRNAIVQDLSLHSEPVFEAQKFVTGSGEYVVNNHSKLEPVIWSATAGLILITLIIAIACLISKRYRFKTRKMELIAMTANQNGLYLQPVNFSELLNNEQNLMKCANTKDIDETYDAIGPLDEKLIYDDGYLKPDNLFVAQLSSNIINHGNLYSDVESIKGKGSIEEKNENIKE
ncbi:hypothetical protein HELRODRAFT_162247 [Helobdella robusta]|uniref:Uncharacterized protein n=1 Tax=Helobdella robusta TaxID=6412 RepID=T1ESE6_HELRO|nr:hypothetical protein HELRODRAFT_162247 [Helobdella robusta]ESN98787.1 hypothetical protein HELRODRAFT_162247 [Helobdella robusta]